MIIHATHFQGTPDHETAERMRIATASWVREYCRGDVRWLNPAFVPPRDSRRAGDPIGVPFVRDIVAEALKHTKEPDDIVFLTNADVGFVSGIAVVIQAAVFTYGCVYFTRQEFAEFGNEPPRTFDQVKAGGPYPGADGFAFTPRWWAANEAIIPDFVMGRFGWDSGFKNVMRRSGGIRMDGCFHHRTHSSLWSLTEDHIQNLPGNVWNRNLLNEWIAKYGGNSEDHLFSLAELNYK